MNAIEKTSGPCVILAGAGTGKTYTIVQKVKHIFDRKIYPLDKVVCITFSNEAANNIVLKIDNILGRDAKEKPIVRTFHGFSADLLRKWGDKIGLSKEFKILDPDQAMILIHKSLKVQAMLCGKYISTIGTAKDLGIKIEEFQDYVEKQMKKYDGVDLNKRLESLSFELQTMHLKRNWDNKKQIVSEIKKIRNVIDVKKFVQTWNAYEKLKVKGNYLDYSDLNKYSLELLQKFPDISEEYKYMIIDEFQDTNKLQLDFVIAMAKHNNITIVGDLNQSIYRFRGAYKENINIFKKAFSVSDKDIFTLAKSRRSPNKVLRMAHKLICNNYQDKDECLFVENFQNKEGQEIEVYEMKNAKEEARKVIELIKRELEYGTEPEEICVLFRAHQHGRIIRKVLEQENIKYYAVAKASLLKQKSVRTARDYLIILEKLKKKEKGGEQAWWDLIYRSDFSQEDLIKIGKVIKDLTRENRRGEQEKKEKEIVSVHLFNNLEKMELSEEGKIASRMLIERIKLMLPSLEKPVSQILQDVITIAGLVKEHNTKEGKESFMNLNLFVDRAKLHEELYDSDLSNFLYYLDILQDLGLEIEATSLEEEGIRLMTSHATKGLEYNVVILTNMAQGRFPIERYVGNGLIPTELLPEVKNEISGLNEEEKIDFVANYEKHNQLLEERRLAYVSFTRAREKLILTYATNYGNKKATESRFLEEISFKNNKEIKFVVDDEEKFNEPEAEIKHANEFSKTLSSGNFEEELNKIISSSERKIDKEEHKRFSPSALRQFEECQKEYEYKYVFNMPERKTIGWEAMKLGSFVHTIFERGVKAGFKKADEFLQMAKELNMEEEWASVELNEAEILIRVFFERHKGRYNKESKTEQYLTLELAGMNFMGYADRIDINSEGEAEIIDYKTGKWAVSPKDRNWQLGFYALAAQAKYGKVRRVMLDMLKQERPLEFEIDEKGNAHCISSKFIEGFNIYEVEQELIKTAHAVQQAYKIGFKPCPIEKNCDFCNEYVYGL